VRRERSIFTSLILVACSPEPSQPADDRTAGSDMDDGGASEEDTDAGDGDVDGDSTDGAGASFIASESEGDDESASPDELAAVAACEAFAGATRIPVVAASSPADAATAPIVSDSTSVYQVTLPEAAPGFLLLEIAGWGTVQDFFTTVDIEYTVTVENDSQFPYPREINAMCPDSGITQQRIGFPHWNPALIEFGAEGPREVPLMIIEE
jgi:hypothetical protein